jgi:hypothetical protein
MARVVAQEGWTPRGSEVAAFKLAQKERAPVADRRATRAMAPSKARKDAPGFACPVNCRGKRFAKHG